MPSKHALMQAIEKAAAGVAEAAAAAEWCYQLRINEIQQELDHQLSSVRSASEAKLAEIDAAEKRDKEALAQAEAQHQRRLEAIQAELDEQLRAARADSARRAAEIQQGYEESLDQVQNELKRVEQGAGIWAAPWDSTVWSSYQPAPGPPDVARFGTLTIEGSYSTIATPALLPFTGGGNFVIKASGAAKARAAEAVQSLALRLLATVPPSKLRLLLVDPVGLGQNVAAFMHLTDYMKDLVTSQAWTEPADIEKRLADLSAHMEMVIQKYLRNKYQNMEEYNQRAGEVEEPYRLLVAVNFPVNFSDQAARRLISIATNGPRCGVYTILTIDADQKLPRDFNIADLERVATVVSWEKDKFVWHDRDFRVATLDLDSPPPPEKFEALVQAIGASAKDSSRVELPFAKIAPEKGTWWHSATTDGLTVPIGRAGAEGKQIFSVGQGTAVHALVAGRTGSGKSTLMHMLILSLGLTYPPDELELYMIDFKKGVEFKDYAPGDDGDWSLPHARVIAIESEREFGLSCLQGLDAELQRRGEIFRDAGCSQFSEYRQRSKIKLPRILLLVDEFHEFFSEDDPIARQASSLLDRLARQGRAFGMHMILGSQTLSAGHALPRSTMDQMAVRIALKCSEEDSRFIVGDNSAYALLTRQGEAIYNASGGLKEGNTRFQVAWLDEGDRKELLRSLHDLAQSRSISVVSPIVFEGNAAARLEENRSLQALLGAPGWPAPGRFVQAFLGQPVAIKDPTSAKFYRQAGRHLLVVGKEEAACVGIMASAVSSLMAQLTPASAEFYLLNMASADTTWAELPDVFAENFPHTVRALARRKVPEAIAEIATIVDIRLKEDTPRGPSIFVAGIGLHRVRELQQDDGGSWGKQEKASTPASQLAKILKDGPEVGVHVLGWWDSYSSLTRAVDRKSLREFGMRVALGMSGEDSSHLLDVPAAAKLGPHRAFFWDEDQVGQLEKFIPCGPPSENWLARAGEQLKRRARDPGANERP
jgi:energy-coupling factor transporter ATP-binding protein EcfA2